MRTQKTPPAIVSEYAWTIVNNIASPSWYNRTHVRYKTSQWQNFLSR